MIEQTAFYSYAQGDEPIPGLRLVQFLGEGGFGKVWKAVRPGETEVAVKIIRLDGGEGRREFRALEYVKRIRHANLVPIHAFWLKDIHGRILDDTPVETELSALPTSPPQPMPANTASLSFLAAKELVIEMGLCDKTLADRLDECLAEGLPGIPAGELLDYMDGATAAIDFLNSPIHSFGQNRVGVQHCDIKPKNIMLVGGSVQVCDFGLARIVGPVRSTTVSAGTLAYEAPECLQHGKPSASTDQYSLAISYYQLRTGRLPYEVETVGAVTHAILQGKFDFSGVTPAEQAVLRRATATEPGRRYPSARAFAQALRDASAATAETPPRRIWPWAALPAGVAVAVAAAWLILGGDAIQPDDSTHEGATVVPESPPLREVVQTGDDPPASTPTPSAIDPAAPPVADISPVLDEAKRLLEASQFEEAERRLTEAIRAGPPSALAHSRLAAAQWHLGKFSDVVETLTRALAIEPNARDLVTRGRAHKELGNLAEAAADFQEASSLDPDDGDAQYLLAECQRMMGEHALALEAYDRAVLLYDKTPDPLYDLPHAQLWRGTCCLSLGKLDGAAEAFEAALQAPGKLEPIGALLDELAARLEAGGRPDEAAVWRRRASAQRSGGGQ